MRDVTSGAFAPRYSPHYRVIAVHGPNRIVVRDEKGNESVRRASHLKHCDPKTKFSSMIPDNREYEEFRWSTKLLLHPKDIPDIHFPKESNTNEEPNRVEQVVINNITESIAEIATRQHKTGEIPPKARIDNNDDNVSECRTTPARQVHEILPVKGDNIAHASNREPQKRSWFSLSVTGMGKLSNALKEGVFGKKGGCTTDMAAHWETKNEDKGFSFFI